MFPSPALLDDDGQLLPSGPGGPDLPAADPPVKLPWWNAAEGLAALLLLAGSAGVLVLAL